LRVVVFFFEAAGFAWPACTAAVFAAAAFADAAFAAADFAAVGFAAADFAAAGFAVAARCGRLDDSAAEPEEDPRRSDAPVSVPSAASSSFSERETEVTQTTYQCPPPERSSTPRWGDRKLGIP
jgi:hypothetical protein